MGWRGDTLWVADSRDDRVTLFTAAGNLIRTVRIASGTESPPAGSLPARDREFTTFEPVAMLSASSFIGTARSIPSGSPWYLRISPDWKEADTVTSGVSPEIGVTVSMQPASGSGYAVAVAQIPHLAEPLSAVSANGDRIAKAITEMLGDNGQVQLKVVDASGRPLLEKSWPFTGAAIASGQLGKLVDKIRARTSQPVSVRKALEDRVREQFPRVYPPVTDLRLTKDGSIWLELGNHLDTRTWLRLDARGNAVHTISLPRNARLEESDGKIIWASETDGDGLRSVVRYRLL